PLTFLSAAALFLPSAFPFARHFLALLARFRKADGDGLLAAFHGAAATFLAAFQLAALLAVHRALHVLAGAARIFPGHIFLQTFSNKCARKSSACSVNSR